MTDRGRADLLQGSLSHRRPSELLRTYVSDPQSPQPDEVQRLVSEFEVRQTELEAQNQELREAKRQLEAYRDRYVDLYDFAPLGYATLDEDGYVQEMTCAFGPVPPMQSGDRWRKCLPSEAKSSRSTSPRIPSSSKKARR